MAVLFRAVVYASLFIVFVLIYLPGRILWWFGFDRPALLEWPQVTGMILTAIGAAMALSCIAVFVGIGKGTPAPFDPPRRLVVRGPYRFVRNPMYIGAAIVLAGAALYFGSWPLLLYGVVLLSAAHCFVVFYEEPTLKRSFGAEYESYCRRVRRWWPGMAR